MQSVPAIDKNADTSRAAWLCEWLTAQQNWLGQYTGPPLISNIYPKYVCFGDQDDRAAYLEKQRLTVQGPEWEAVKADAKQHWVSAWTCKNAYRAGSPFYFMVASPPRLIWERSIAYSTLQGDKLEAARVKHEQGQADWHTFAVCISTLASGRKLVSVAHAQSYGND